MIRRLLFMYHWGYPKSLVYMLQTSEYNMRDYMDWLRRTKDYRTVASRGKLVMTTKAQLLYFAAWLFQNAATLLTLFFVISFLFLFVAQRVYQFELSLYLWQLAYIGALYALLRYGLPYLLLIPLLVGKVLIQQPKERRIIHRARAILTAHKAVKIVVAGSFGKTTFKETLASVLAEGKTVASTPGNYNTPLGIAKFAADLAGNEDVLVIEAGEYYPGDVRRICEIAEPTMGVITGVNQQHQMRFKTVERGVATIFELADYLSRVQAEASNTSLWVNGESELAAKQAIGQRYSRKGVGEWAVTGAKTSLEGTVFTAQRGKTTVKAKSRLMGLHQVGPLAAIIDIATELGLTPRQIESGIAKTEPFKHRMSPSEYNGVITIDDTYNGNPDGFRAAIEFLSSLKGHRRVYVTPGIVELGSATVETHRGIGRQLAQSGIETIILIKNSATPYIEEGLQEGNYPGRLIWQPDIMSALTTLSQLTAKGDVVYLQNDWSDNYA